MDFVRQQPLKAQQKIAYNIRKLECGIMDKELFKKLENSDIWNYGLCSMACVTDFLLSGIRK